MVWIISPAVSYLRARPHKGEGWDFAAAKKYLVVVDWTRRERINRKYFWCDILTTTHLTPTVCVERVSQVLFIQLAFKLPIFNWFWTNINHNARFLFTIAERAVAERFGNWNESIVLSRLLLSNMEKYLCLAKTVLLQHLCMQHKQSLCNLCHCLLIWY